MPNTTERELTDAECDAIESVVEGKPLNITTRDDALQYARVMIRAGWQAAIAAQPAQECKHQWRTGGAFVDCVLCGVESPVWRPGPPEPLCDCDTKTPELRFHSANCAYRVYNEPPAAHPPPPPRAWFQLEQTGRMIDWPEEQAAEFARLNPRWKRVAAQPERARAALPCGDVSGPYTCHRPVGHAGPHGSFTANWPNAAPIATLPDGETR